MRQDLLNRLADPGKRPADKAGQPHSESLVRTMPADKKPPRRPIQRQELVAPGGPDRNPAGDVSTLIRSLSAQGEQNLMRKLRLAGVDPMRDLVGADLTGTDLHGLDLRGIDLSRAILRWTDIADARLEGAKLVGAQAAQARFEAAHCRGTDFSGAQLRQANLRDADLSDADLRGADLREATMLGAAIDGMACDEDLTAVAAAIASPSRLLDGLDRAVDTREGIVPPGPLGLGLLADGIVAAILQGALYGACGIEPSFYDPEAHPGPFVPYLLATVEEIGMRLEPNRKELRFNRHQSNRDGQVDSAARDDMHVGALAILARSFDEAGEHLSAARRHMVARRQLGLGAMATALQGCLALERMDHVEAVRQLRRALETSEEIADKQGQARYAIALLVLAIIHWEWDRAQEFVRRLAALAPEGDGERIGRLRDPVLGALMWRLGDGGMARKRWSSSAEALQRQGLRQDAAMIATLATLTARIDLARPRGS
ncbi:MAG: pentapeptide repeat-containing protein [Alphaproteobacteria bacterium]|nr:pentapeptide repeat-containing protein [Alphaproteobacteria bacterium]